MRSNRVLKTAIAIALAGVSGLAFAQEAPNTITELETVIVTGTYIRGAAEDAALPVDVITSEDLAKQGSPSMVELIKSIPAVQGVFGESNQYATSQAAGAGNINLRGLGAARTLVLLNGKRLSNSPAVGVNIDTNLLPVAAIERVEVLKDGAAATYGSDAIGGVVNFITKNRFEGLSLDASYTYIDGSDGDYDANAAWGWQGDISSVLLAAGYRHRSKLSTTERDWALRPRSENAEGGWSGFSNPGTFVTLTTLPVGDPGNPNPFPLSNPTGSFGDPACTTLGGTLAPGCAFQYTAFNNLVEKEDHYNIFAEYKLDVSDALEVRAEVLWAMHDVPDEHVSPSYGPNQGPNGGAPSYFIPEAHPGLVALLPYLTAGQQTAIGNSTLFNPAATGSFTTQDGIVVSGLQWRPFATGGNPATGGSAYNSRKFDGFRAAVGARGDLGDAFSWDVGAAYGENGSEISTPDILVARLQLALRGLGGPGCNTPTPGINGCQWLNPFSTGIASNPATGNTNTLTYTGGVDTASPELVRWLETPNSYETTTSLLVFDAVVNGELGFLELPGGATGWALGVQYRENTYELEATDPFINPSLYPCGASPVNPAATCEIPVTGTPRGTLAFYGPTANVDVSQDVIAAFTEFSFPIFDSLSAQLAVRHEDYGNPVGATTNPKLSVRYQPIDALTIRGSYGSTFRAPPQTTLQGTTTFLFFTPQASGFKPVDTVGNANLKPETADTFNVGFIVSAGGFFGSVDYWNFKFDDALTTEVGTQLVTALYTPYVDPVLGPQADHCNDPSPEYTALRTRFTFSGPCRNPNYVPPLQVTGSNAQAANLLRTRVNNINAQSEIKVSGVDVALSYDFDYIPGGDWTVGAEGTYNLEYKLGANYVEGVLIDPAQDAIGTRGGRGGSLPQWRGSAYVNLASGDHNIRWTTRYMDGVEDLRTASFVTNQAGRFIGSFLTHDLVYRVQLPSEMTFALSVINLTDKDPPFARLDLNYDPFLANPLGRYIKAGFGVKF